MTRLLPILSCLSLIGTTLWGADPYGTVIEEWAEDPDSIETGPSVFVDGDLIVGGSSPSHSVDTVMYGGLDVTGNSTNNVVVFGSYTSKASNGMPEGNGSRLVWHPGKSAFRVGYAFLGTGDDSNIGYHSSAIGNKALASGASSVAIGNSAEATGLNGLAVGFGSEATGQNSSAFGFGASSTGYGSLAFGRSGEATNNDAVAFSYAEATGSGAIAAGYSALAQGSDSVAFGYATQAIGDRSHSINGYTIANGQYSFAAGLMTNAEAYNSFVVGRYNRSLDSNDSVPNATAWEDDDPVFEIGIGNGQSGHVDQYKNAVTVYKNGDVDIAGAITVKSYAGDISMGIYGN
ncbi:hypothetical protein [Cerasicoccus frondis]|uniref:hypothetical protein n=1 Tax=Cerasicoccus frondis TaxID=490090 RepID=UPI002852643B|nr:hypothetical protein [Cerasicoccus frondis]